MKWLLGLVLCFLGVGVAVALYLVFGKGQPFELSNILFWPKVVMGGLAVDAPPNVKLTPSGMSGNYASGAGAPTAPSNVTRFAAHRLAHPL